MTDSHKLQALEELTRLDGILHEPARLVLMSILSVIRKSDFVFLANQTGLSKGNLSVQMSRLAEAGYVDIEKAFLNNRPRTTYRMTHKGRLAFSSYRKTMLRLLRDLPD